MRPLDPRLLRRVRPARVALAADVLFGFLATIALLIQATLFAAIVARAFEHRPLDPREVIAFCGVVVARAVFAAGFEATGRRAAALATSELRMALVERRLFDMPTAADGAEAGEIAAAAVSGVDGLEAYFARYLPQLVLAVLVPIAVLAWTAAIDLTSVVIMVLTLPLIPVFMVLIGRYTESKTRARWVALTRLSNHFLDVVRGLPTLRAFNRGAAQAERIEAVSEAYRRTTMETLRVSFLSGAVLDLAATLATALVAVTLGVRLVEGTVAFRPALTVLLLTPELYIPLRSLAAQFHVSADGLAAAERILDLIEAPETPAVGTDRVPDPWRSLRLRDISLRNEERGSKLLDGFDLTIERGEVVALVGPSGAGKSTVAALLLGLRTPDGGTITVDGTDLATLDLRGWRTNVAWVPQRPTVFRGSVRDNIAIGNPSASIEQIDRASKAAGLDEVVADLPRGYESDIGEGARGLSAGETRRLALARALARSAQLVILDEPTANLDAESGESIAASIRELGADRAVLLIAHSPELARSADRIVRIEDGRAVAVSKQAVLP
ncbi:MAG TPA: thiol reductant ABC exporter subunit CydD [Actinomycetota bacterium]